VNLQVLSQYYAKVSQGIFLRLHSLKQWRSSRFVEILGCFLFSVLQCKHKKYGKLKIPDVRWLYFFVSLFFCNRCGVILRWHGRKLLFSADLRSSPFQHLQTVFSWGLEGTVCLLQRGGFPIKDPSISRLQWIKSRQNPQVDWRMKSTEAN